MLYRCPTGRKFVSLIIFTVCQWYGTIFPRQWVQFFRTYWFCRKKLWLGYLLLPVRHDDLAVRWFSVDAPSTIPHRSFHFTCRLTSWLELMLYVFYFATGNKTYLILSYSIPCGSGVGSTSWMLVHRRIQNNFLKICSIIVRYHFLL